jgi:hypothetical protein
MVTEQRRLQPVARWDTRGEDNDGRESVLRPNRGRRGRL